MKRSTKLALSLVLAVGTVAPAFAQDNFPDVPANHWAYEALARMKRDGLLVGYPDGLYRGGRPASRYELAVAMHAVYTNLKNITDGLDAQIRALQGNNPSAGDIQALKDAVAALQADVAAMKGYGDDIAALKRAAETFDRELKSLGVDVEAMKKDLLDLSGRVKALEDKKPAIEISGDVNLLILAGNSSGNRPGLNQDGRLVGVSANGGPAGLDRDFNVLHEAAFTFAGTNPSGVKFTGTAVIGNLLPNFGSQSVLPAGRYSDAGLEDIYIQNLEASFDTKFPFISGGVGVKVGRIGEKVSPYLFQRIDNTSFYSNERWDNGKYAIDGAAADFKLFGASVGGFVGRSSDRATVQSNDLNQIVLGNNRVAGNSTLSGLPAGGVGTSQENVLGGLANTSDVDRILGVKAAFPLFKVGNVNLAYLWMDTDNSTNDALLGSGGSNRVEVYGGDVDFTFGRIKVGGSLNQSVVKENSTAVQSSYGTAFDAKVGVNFNKFNVYGKYREVAADYVAPGDWGRLGILRNPAGIRGFQFGGSLNISDLLVLSGSGEVDSGLDQGGDLVPQLFDGNTEINNYAVRLDYKFSPNVSLFGQYENTRFGGLVNSNGGTARYNFATLGVGYGLSERAKLNVSYQYGDVDNEAFLVNGGDRYKGGLLSTQLTIKF